MACAAMARRERTGYISGEGKESEFAAEMGARQSRDRGGAIRDWIPGRRSAPPAAACDPCVGCTL
jgi:hypothetical protein